MCEQAAQLSLLQRALEEYKSLPEHLSYGVLTQLQGVSGSMTKDAAEAHASKFTQVVQLFYKPLGAQEGKANG